MDINATILQIKKAAPFFAGQVAGAADLQATIDKAATKTYPWAYVVPLGSEASPNTSMNSLDQDVIEKIGVVVVLDNATNPADRRGAATSAAYTLAKQSLWSALLYGFNTQPDLAARGLYYVRDELVQQDTARSIYEFEFAQEIHITEDQGFINSGDDLTEITVNLDGSPAAIVAIDQPDGTADTNSNALIAGPSGVSGHRVLMPLGDNSVGNADPTNPAYVFSGISTGAAAAGQPVSVVLDGPLIEPSWSWPARAALFVGPAGTLVTTPPTSGISQQVAVAISPTTIFVAPYQPIQRA